MLLCNNYWKFWTFSMLQNKFSEKRKPFSKNWSSIYSLKVLILKTHHFYTKLPCQKPLLRQVEWGVQNGHITKNGVLPVTALFFRKFYFSLRTSHEEFIWCTNYSNVDIHTFRKRWSFIRWCFFPVSIPKFKQIFWCFQTLL